MYENSLFEKACEEILKLKDVRKTDKNSFRIGSKVFLRYESTLNATIFGFKLLSDDANMLVKNIGVADL